MRAISRTGETFDASQSALKNIRCLKWLNAALRDKARIGVALQLSFSCKDANLAKDLAVSGYGSVAGDRKTFDVWWDLNWCCAAIEDPRAVRRDQLTFG